jgi:hypothetical protein
VPRILKFGLVAAAGGIGLLVLSTGGGWGPCGPGTLMGAVALTFGLFTAPVGVLICFAGVANMIRRKPVDAQDAGGPTTQM